MPYAEPVYFETEIKDILKREIWQEFIEYDSRVGTLKLKVTKLPKEDGEEVRFQWEVVEWPRLWELVEYLINTTMRHYWPRLYTT